MESTTTTFGTHGPRLWPTNFALVDVLGTVWLAYAFPLLWDDDTTSSGLLVNFIFYFVLAIVVHWLFGVSTGMIQMALPGV